jgi:hypothetical protein
MKAQRDRRRAQPRYPISLLWPTMRVEGSQIWGNWNPRRNDPERVAAIALAGEHFAVDVTSSLVESYFAARCRVEIPLHVLGASQIPE